MRKLLLTSALTLSLAGIGFAEEMTGVISDAHCGAKHSTASADAAKCVSGCLKGGADPVLVSGGKVYKLDAGSREKAAAFAGQNVKVDGTVNGDTITVSSISAGQ